MSIKINNTNQLPKIKNMQNKEHVPEQFRKVARGMETQFAKLMIDQMNKTVQKADKQGSAENYYTSLLDYERAKMMTEGEGLGLQKVILNQLYPKRLRQNLANQHSQIKMAPKGEQ